MIKGDLKAILENGEVDATVRYFEQATETERKEMAEWSLEWYRLQEMNWFIKDANGGRINPLTQAASAAFLATGTLSQLKKHGRNLSRSDTDFTILAARKPDWLTEYAAWSLEKSPAVWPAVRRLERAGLCQRPDTDNYILGMIEGHADRSGKPDVREAFLADRALLDREVWRLFEVEGSGEYSLAARDKYSRADATWDTGLIALANEGILSRGRLLDASLDALERDFAQFRAGWFSRFHEALKPTLEERAERIDRYLNLLASKVPPTVSFALNALALLDRHKRLPAGLLLERINPALYARSKGTVISALKLLANAASREPDLKQRAAMIAAEALVHESPDVQAAAFDLAIRLGHRDDLSLASTIMNASDQLAPSIQGRVQEWLGPSDSKTPAAPPSESELGSLIARASTLAPSLRELAGIEPVINAIRDGRFDAPALVFDGTEFPHLDPTKKIQPILDLDELIDRFSAVLENADDTDEVERVLDGVSRLCGERPDTFETLTKPLQKRAVALLKRLAVGSGDGAFLGWQVGLDLCGLAVRWTGGNVTDPGDVPWIAKESAETLSLSQRVLAIARRAAIGQSQPLLSAPTHRGGWIDPIVLVDRIELCERNGCETDILDQIQAILRTTNDHRERACRRLSAAVDEFRQALHYALGGEVEVIGPTASLWVAAARARKPFDDDPRVMHRHQGLGPDAGTAARYQHRVKLRPMTNGKNYAEFHLDRDPPVPPQVPPELVTTRFHNAGNAWGRINADSATLRWGATVWPIAREAWLAQGVVAIATNIDWWEARWSNRTYLEALTDPDIPLKPMALLLLAIGLAAKQAVESGLATDGLIAAIHDGRLDGTRLGVALRSLLPTTLIKPSRWAKTLGDAARISPLHVRVIAIAIQETLRDELDEKPRDLLPLLELLKELITKVGESIAPPLRDWLARWKASGKTAKVVKELLAIAPREHSADARAAMIIALTHRIERAERWSRCVAHEESS